MVAAPASTNKAGGDLPARPPLIPSERDNAAVSRRPRAKEVASRYLSSPSSSSTTSTSTSSSHSSSSRRFPSPIIARPLSTPQPNRSQSVGRTRPLTPRPREPPPTPTTTAARVLCTTTRSLSVSFQGESFFYQTSKTKVTSPSSSPNAWKASRRHRIDNAPPVEQSENSGPSALQRRKPAIKGKHPNPLIRSLNSSLEKGLTVGLLQQSVLYDAPTRRSTFDSSADLLVSSDNTNSVSSGSNSGAQESLVLPKARSALITVPSRLWQEANGGVVLRSPRPGTPTQSPPSRTLVPPRLDFVRKASVDSRCSSPRAISSPLRGPSQPSSPSRLAGSPSKGMTSSTSQTKNAATVSSTPACPTANAPSIIRFAADVRRAKKGENRIEEAHLLRLYDNRHMQWRWANARADASFSLQRLTAEKNLYNAQGIISEMRDSVSTKRLELQILTQNIKLNSILKGQMNGLENWSLMDRDHSSFLSETIEALKASTIRLPVVDGAKAGMQEVKDVVGSSVDVMQAMGYSICSLLSKVQGTSSVVSELAKTATQEKALLNQLKDLVSTFEALHVEQCSRHSHLLQLRREACHQL